MNKIYQQIKHKILVLDGAMGTMIQNYKLTEKDYRGDRFKNITQVQKGNNDMLSITQPHIIEEIHSMFLNAGADIIETNTFNANSVSMADYQMENLCYELNYNSAKIAKKITDRFNSKEDNKPRFVAGSMGPTNKTASMSSDVNDPAYREVTFDDLKIAYAEQAGGLIDGGADLLIVETIFDTLNAKAALFAIEEVCREKAIKIPIMVSCTISDASGRLLTGQTVEAFLNSVAHFDIFSIGLNCALGAKEMRQYIEELSKKAPFYVHAYPNAGLPDEFGEYTENPEKMSIYVKDILDNRFVNIIGGCCGTTPEHIKLFAELAAKSEIRPIPKQKKRLKLSGLEPLTIFPGSNFINIGERTNVAGSKKFARLIAENKYEEALSVASDQVDGGAQIIDINMDDAMIDSKTAMVKFLNLIASDPDIAKLPLMIDSSKWEVIEAALKCVQGKAIVNSISLKEGEEIFKEQAKKIKQFGAAVIVMAFDEKGQADSSDRKIEICERSYNILTKDINFTPEDIIFDPNVLAIATGIKEHNNYAVDFITAVKWIKENLPYARTSGGISNLSFSFRGNNKIREAMHSVFLYHAINIGLDMGIVNPGLLQVYDEIPEELIILTEDVILNRRKDATERLIIYSQKTGKSAKTSKKRDNWREENIAERISHSLVKGISDFIETDINVALDEYPDAVSIIEGPLMDGMKKVGDLFGSGKMFLPQVIKSARVMKKAVIYLSPYVEKEKIAKGEVKISGKIVLATVKGDVHDIGKNIISVVLACNNIEIIDLGVMTAPGKILEIARAERVNIIGLSGLITPSLDEMIHIAQEMKRLNLNIPMLVGGATTSEKHTAIKIATTTNVPVFHIKDASKIVSVVSGLLSKDLRNNLILEEQAKQDSIRKSYLDKQSESPLISLDEARKNKFKTDWNSIKITKPSFIGNKLLLEYPLEIVSKYINWTFFFHSWKITGIYPSIFNDPIKGDEARKIHDDALQMLSIIFEKRMLQANVVIGLYPANSVGDDIEIYENESRQTVLKEFHFLRNQEANKINLCLADFIAPKETGINDYLGCFVVTSGLGIEKWIKKFESKNDDYSVIMLKILATHLAEALAELIHERVRKEIWGYANKETMELESLFKCK